MRPLEPSASTLARPAAEEGETVGPFEPLE